MHSCRTCQETFFFIFANTRDMRSRHQNNPRLVDFVCTCGRLDLSLACKWYNPCYCELRNAFNSPTKLYSCDVSSELRNVAFDGNFAWYCGYDGGHLRDFGSVPRHKPHVDGRSDSFWCILWKSTFPDFFDGSSDRKYYGDRHLSECPQHAQNDLASAIIKLCDLPCCGICFR